MSDHKPRNAEDSPLGKAVSYCAQYAPQLLFPIARSDKRLEIGIDPHALPFAGEDIWNAYELSWLNPRGKPVVALGEFRVPATSGQLIESKSLKLYLNSFNQTRFADIAEVSQTIAQDLSKAAGEVVTVKLQAINADAKRPFGTPAGVCLDDIDIDIEHYRPGPHLLSMGQGHVEDETLYSHLLKSNCLVTGQPDWGMVAIRYSGPRIAPESLLRYIVSFREHNEFHEQCVERIFIDLTTRCRPDRLAVWARYTRRGGLDINPFRTSELGWIATNLAEVRQ